MTMSRLASTVNRKMNRKTRKRFLQVWILHESQQSKFSHIVGMPEEIHLGSNIFQGPALPTKD